MRRRATATNRVARVCEAGHALSADHAIMYKRASCARGAVPSARSKLRAASRCGCAASGIIYVQMSQAATNPGTP
jgi:hypothetical protein